MERNAMIDSKEVNDQQRMIELLLARVESLEKTVNTLWHHHLNDTRRNT